MNLDLPTIIALIIVGAFVIGGSLLVVGRGYLGQIPGLSQWAIATLLQALGWSIYGPARGVIPDLVSILVGNALIVFSLGLYLMVLAEFSEQVVSRALPYGLVAIQSVLLTYFTLVSPNVSARITVISACGTLLVAMCGRVLLLGRTPRPASHTVTGIMFGIAAAFGATRTVHYLIWSTNPALAPFAPDIITGVSFVVFYLTGIMFNFGFLLMVIDRYIEQRADAEARLRASEERFRAIVNAEPECVKLVSPDGSLMEMNAAGLAMIEAASIEEARARPLIDLVAAEYRPAYRALQARSLAGEGGRLEFEAMGLRGTKRWLETHAVPMRDADGRVTSVLDITRDITERRAGEQAMGEAIREQEALLKEVHHRVKNNLQVITSLLRLESGRNGDAGTRSALDTMRARIQSMALLHETLYRSGNFVSVDLGAYLTRLATQSLRTLSVHSERIELDLAMAPIQVEMERAIPCGLLVNELISNCLKHGFPAGAGGSIRLELSPLEDNRVRLCVSDNGTGLPADFLSKREQSLGLRLASDLARQLGGALQIGPPPAAAFSVVFTVGGRTS